LGEDAKWKNMKSYLGRAAVVAILAIVMYEIAVPCTGMVFTNRYDQTQLIRLRSTFQAAVFEAEHWISNVTGEDYVILSVRMEAENLTLYSKSFNLSEISSVGWLKVSESTKLLIVSRLPLEDGKEYVVTGKNGDFQEKGSSKATGFTVTECHEPTMLEEFVSENSFLFATIAIISWVAFATCTVYATGYFVVASIETES
jgi:hypothetical protein